MARLASKPAPRVPTTPTVEVWRAMSPAERLDFQLRAIDALKAKKADEEAKCRAERARADAIEARARGVLAVLQARGLPVSDAARERVLGERDAARLDQWLDKAVVAASVEEVLGAL